MTLVVVGVFEKKREHDIGGCTGPARGVDVVGDGDEECIQLIVHTNRHTEPSDKTGRAVCACFVTVGRRLRHGVLLAPLVLLWSFVNDTHPTALPAGTSIW